MAFLVNKKEIPFLITNLDKLTVLGKYIIPCIIKYRNDLVLNYLSNESRHLDLGCGQGYLVINSPCNSVIGIDKTGGFGKKSRGAELTALPGFDLEKPFEFEDNSFDIVTSVALIEHISNIRFFFTEVWRVLKNEGKFLFTTPLPLIEKMAPLLDNGSSQLSGNNIKSEHKGYFNKKLIVELIDSKFNILLYKKFMLGLNQ
ncbi:MAG: class I SAM-dependent methyltransferase, partial [bacterium]